MMPAAKTTKKKEPAVTREIVMNMTIPGQIVDQYGSSSQRKIKVTKNAASLTFEQTDRYAKGMKFTIANLKKLIELAESKVTITDKKES